MRKTKLTPELRHSAYLAFQSIRQRCTNRNNKDFLDYGGRGIECALSQEEFAEVYYRTDCCELGGTLLNDENRKKADGRTIDRIDHDGDSTQATAALEPQEFNPFFPRGDYSALIHTRTHLTGDWGGWRTHLALRLKKSRFNYSLSGRGIRLRRSPVRGDEGGRSWRSLQERFCGSQWPRFFSCRVASPTSPGTPPFSTPRKPDRTSRCRESTSVMWGKRGGSPPRSSPSATASSRGSFTGVVFRAVAGTRRRFAFRGEREVAVTRVVGTHGERLKFENENLKGQIENGVFSGTALMFLNEVEDARFGMKRILRVSPTLGLEAPPEAVVLFNGNGVDEWVNGRVAEGNLLDVGTESKRKFGSIRFHLEFRTPFMPHARGMGRGNSGVYVKKEYEIQIVDSFGWNSENRKFERLSGFGRCGGIHEMVKPRVNMCFPPLSWQTYDVEYTMARFDASGKKLAPATLTVRHNGVVIHDRYVLPATPAESPPTDERAAGPLFLQDHGNPVRYRNIWVLPRD